MDPVSALGLTANVLQFVEFTGKLISKGAEYYQSSDGALLGHAELNAAAENLASLARKINESTKLPIFFPKGPEPLNRTERENYRADKRFYMIDKGLLDASRHCYDISLEMNAALTALKIPDNPTRWDCFRQALRSVWSEEKINGISRRLDQARDQLMIHLLVDLRFVVPRVVSVNQWLTIVLNSSQNAIDHHYILKQGSALEQNILNTVKRCFDSVRGDITRLTATLGNAAIKLNQPSPEDGVEIVRLWQSRNPDKLATLNGLLEEVTENDRITHTEDKLLDSLYFTRIEERRERIPQAHAKTFSWLFEEAARDTNEYSHFRCWLETDIPHKNIFWICGKPGSGKSTLMKFLEETEATKHHLEKWAGGCDILVARCFFWKEGTTFQKSLLGLVRSLLYRLLTQRRCMVPRVDPWRWRALYLGASQLDEWSDTELKLAFQTLLNNLQGTTKVALLVDGLDEFDGDEHQLQELVDMFLTWGSSSSIKICVSSRPWNLFKDSFADCPQLRLELLTRPDIELYVKDKLDSNRRFATWRQYDPQGCAALISEVADKATGVFLWVYLVVRELCKGIRNGLQLHSLRQRLDTLPGELDAFFLTMIESIDPSDRVTASRVLQVMVNARQPLSLMALSFCEEEEADFALGEIAPQNSRFADILLRNDSMARRINSVCMGMLESKDTTLPMEVPDDLACLEEFDVEVYYMHRTIKEFLLTPRSQQVLWTYTNGPYDTHRYIANSTATLIMFLHALTSNEAVSREISQLKQTHFLELANQLMCCFEQIERCHNYTPVALLDKVQPVVVEQMPHLGDHTGSMLHEANRSWYGWNCSFLTLAIQYNLTIYVTAQLKGQPFKARDGRPLLDFALCRRLQIMDNGNSPQQNDELPPNPELVRLLLSFGADPNQIYGSSSVWDAYVFHLTQLKRVRSPAWAETAELLAKHGVPLSAATLLKLRACLGDSAAERLTSLVPIIEASKAPKHRNFKRWSREK